ncbi:hypothetical protein HOY80DRAFT_1102887 [Tuber brumale]|nr:hypothetical protein HOY80DRAFT_1102887 [Tuber brumale]
MAVAAVAVVVVVEPTTVLAIVGPVVAGAALGVMKAVAAVAGAGRLLARHYQQSSACAAGDPRISARTQECLKRLLEQNGFYSPDTIYLLVALCGPAGHGVVSTGCACPFMANRLVKITKSHISQITCLKINHTLFLAPSMGPKQHNIAARTFGEIGHRRQLTMGAKPPYRVPFSPLRYLMLHDKRNLTAIDVPCTCNNFFYAYRDRIISTSAAWPDSPFPSPGIFH